MQNSRPTCSWLPLFSEPSTSSFSENRCNPCGAPLQNNWLRLSFLCRLLMNGNSTRTYFLAIGARPCHVRIRASSSAYFQYSIAAGKLIVRLDPELLDHTTDNHER